MTLDKKAKRINVLVVYQYYVQYRLPVMRKLAQDKEVQYSFLGGQADQSGIPSVTIEMAQKELFQWRVVKNIWLFKGRLLWQSGLIRECLTKKYDGIIFLGNPYFLSTWVAVVLVRLAGKKIFYWAHATIRNQLRDKLKLVFFRLADGLLLYGNEAKRTLVKHGFDPKRIFVIYNSLDYEKQKELKEKINAGDLQEKRKQLFLHPEYPILMFIGRLTTEKKLDYLIKACAQLHQQEIPVNVLLIGSGVEREGLEHLVSENNLQDFVFFQGECYEEEQLAPLIAMSDLCISPGEVGLTAIHALTYGTPVITHDNPLKQGPEHEAIEQGLTGLFYEYGSVDSLREQIAKWLSENQDKREQIRLRCYEIVNQYYNPSYQALAIKSALHYIVGR